MQMAQMRRDDLDAVITVPVSAVPHWVRAGWRADDGAPPPEPAPPTPTPPEVPAVTDASPEAPPEEAPSGSPKFTRRRPSPESEESA